MTEPNCALRDFSKLRAGLISTSIDYRLGVRVPEAVRGAQWHENRLALREHQVVIPGADADVLAPLQHLEGLCVGEVVVHDYPRSTGGGLVLDPHVLAVCFPAVAKNVTRSPVRGFSMVRGRSSVMVSSLVFALKPSSTPG